MEENKNKNKTCDGYIIYHRPMEYDMWDDEIWKPLQVGAWGKEKILENGYTDCEGDNISKWNKIFWEMSGLYWMWKNGLTGKKYAAFCQYRRRMNYHTIEELDAVFTDYDVIAGPVIFFPSMSVRDQYCLYHSEADLQRAERIVKTLYPDYLDDWNIYINNGKFLFYSNGFVMREEDMKKYCEWLFPIFFKFIEEMGWNDVEDAVEYVKKDIEEGGRPENNGGHEGENAVLNYQSAIFGFLSERLWTLYLLHNFDKKRILSVPYKTYEGLQ